MKLGDLTGMPEKEKESEHYNSSNAIYFRGFNMALSEIADLELVCDVEKLKKILKHIDRKEEWTTYSQQAELLCADLSWLSLKGKA